MSSQRLEFEDISVYWLASASVFTDAVKLRKGHSLEGALPLFDGDMFAGVMAFCPWLVPFSSLKDLSDATTQQGMLLESSSSLVDVLAHLKSLLVAKLEKKDTLLRFYDPKVAFLMLAQLNESELNALLGNISVWSVWFEAEQSVFKKTNLDAFLLQTKPWWEVKPAHLRPFYSISTHAYMLERHLWEFLPDIMTKIPDSLAVITNGLKVGHEQGYNKNDIEIYVFSLLMVAGDGELDQFTDALELNVEERDRLQIFWGDDE